MVIPQARGTFDFNEASWMATKKTPFYDTSEDKHGGFSTA